MLGFIFLVSQKFVIYKFLKKNMNSGKEKLSDEEEELLEGKDPFHVYIIYNIMLYCLNSNFSISLVLFLI